MLPEPRLDLALIGHELMKGSSVADCRCRQCRKWRRALYEQGKITTQQAGIPDVKDEPLGKKR